MHFVLGIVIAIITLMIGFMMGRSPKQTDWTLWRPLRCRLGLHPKNKVKFGVYHLGSGRVRQICDSCRKVIKHISLDDVTPEDRTMLIDTARLMASWPTWMGQFYRDDESEA